MNPVIKVENLSKQYRLGKVGTGTLSHDLNRWWAKVRGKEDPYLKIGSANRRDEKGNSDYVWALRDINFEVKQGEVLGIIGKNGAGKSTLLKILSRVTAPTTGELKVKGRIASLLEVGTGFHPELTGKENVFLNGAILGMTKREIKSKYDEIVEFSGVERYIDTPVKRYSSGMYVRLAFAVAAHLEPEILIVDEVLAVGDAEFQKKCLGKMKDVSGQGRTVLFVSHNMNALNSLCPHCLYLVNGQVDSIGETGKIISRYLSGGGGNVNKVKVIWDENPPGDEVVRLLSARIIDRNMQDVNYAQIDREIGIEVTYKIQKSEFSPTPSLHLYTSREEKIFGSVPQKSNLKFNIGTHKMIMWIPSNFLNKESYYFSISIVTWRSTPLVHASAEKFLIFDVIDTKDAPTLTEDKRSFKGFIRPLFEWTYVE